MKKASKFWYYAGWFELILALAIGIAVLCMLQFGAIDLTLVLRVAIIVPLACWWGIREIRKNKAWRHDD